MKLTNDEIKRRVASAIVEEAYPGYHSTVTHYAVDLDGDGEADTVMSRQNNALWDPWPDNATAIEVGYFAGPWTDYACPGDVEFEDCVDSAVDGINEESSE